VLFNSCSSESEALQPALTGIYANHTATSTVLVNKGYPGDVVSAEGTGLTSLKTVVFDNLIDVPFNPALNSDVASFFTIPFDETKGSRFGVQQIKFTNGSGTVYTSTFEILQPVPIVGSFDPERPKVGTTVSVKGDWFYNIVSVTFGGEAVEYTRVSSKLITFLVPATAITGANVVVTTAGGSGTKFMDIDLGFQVVKVTDFDGGGLRPNNDWIMYGDADRLNYSNVGGTDGNYAELVWAGASGNGYNGCQSSASGSFLKVTDKDPTKVYYLIDVNGTVGGKFDVLLVNSTSNWAYNITLDKTGWQTIKILLSDFRRDYGGGPAGDIDPSDVNQVKVSISQNSGIPNPTKVQFDNLRFNIY
jgi:hypothetical protein